MSKIKQVTDPDLGTFYRVICEQCGKSFQSVSEKAVLNNLINHQGSHNGHA